MYRKTTYSIKLRRLAEENAARIIAEETKATGASQGPHNIGWFHEQMTSGHISCCYPCCLARFWCIRLVFLPRGPGDQINATIAIRVSRMKCRNIGPCSYTRNSKAITTILFIQILCHSSHSAHTTQAITYERKVLNNKYSCQRWVALSVYSWIGMVDMSKIILWMTKLTSAISMENDLSRMPILWHIRRRGIGFIGQFWWKSGESVIVQIFHLIQQLLGLFLLFGGILP